MTTDLEKAEAAARMVGEKRTQLVQQRSALCDERDDVALRAYTGDAQARKRLDEINTALVTHASELELASLDAALRAAGKQVAALQQATNRGIAKQHIERLHELLVAFQELAAPLDKCLGRTVAGSFGGLRYDPGPADPPLLDRAGETIGRIVTQLRAIDLCMGSDLCRDVSWPLRRWSVGHAMDFRQDVQALLSSLGRLPRPSECDFTGLIGALAARIKATIVQYERTNNNVEQAA